CCSFILVFLCTFTFSLPAVKVVQPYRVESTDGRARIQCVFHPHKNPEDLKVTLLRGLHGRQELCSFFLNLTVSFLGEYYVTEERKRQIMIQKITKNLFQVQCSAQTTDGAVEVALSNLTASDTDIYRCEIQTFYPPPYLQLTGNGTLVHVIGEETLSRCVHAHLLLRLISNLCLHQQSVLTVRRSHQTISH
uniref:T-cell-specific surface glycoprotein CD28 homolog n=1 Tax=Oryzias melastigma TaxID=30732 RepID=A0A3B3C440_ORYME